ncbi:MAG: CsiV family protein [Woeseiaceae bacterium]
MKTIAALMLTLLPATFALAQQPGTDEQAAPEEPKHYTVEVVIFTYAESVGVGTEIFPPDAPEPAALPDEETGQAAGDETGAGAPPDTAVPDAAAARNEAPAFAFQVLTSDEYTMQDILDRLHRLDVYRTVMHFGWTQPALSRDETTPIELRTFGDPPAGLDGNFTLYVSRFLHLVVDLSLEADTTAPTDQPVARFGDDRGGSAPDGPQLPVHYRIQENRIVNSGDIRYFDHPKFGVVAKITRVDDADEKAADADGPQSLAFRVGQ